ncbi:MAG: hypothetical protein ACRC1H_09035, partial [Caldilineaceae bacterium]
MATSLPNLSSHQAQPLDSSPPSRSPSHSALAHEQQPSDPPEALQTAVPSLNPMRLALTALATLAILAALFLLQGCNRGEEPEAAPAQDAVVVGTAAPQEAAVLPTPVPVVYSAG